MQSDLSLFAGRFHPLIVHLPIGILLLAVIFYFLSMSARFRGLKSVIPVLLLIGFGGAVISAVAGFLLAQGGGYNLKVLDRHKWVGITMIFVSGLLYLWYRRKNINERLTAAMMLLVLLLVSVTGHLGGTLTHGERYLFEYAPGFIKDRVITEVNIVKGFPADADSVLLYKHFVQPILDNKCISCHQEGNLSGGLNLTHLDSMRKGGETAEAVVGKKPLSSEIFKRVTLDPDDRKYMPPNGAQLSFVETLLLKEWIQQDLDTALSITDERLSDELMALITQYYQVDTRRKDFIEKLKMDSLSSETLDELRIQGFHVRTMLSNLLDVKVKDSLKSGQLDYLKQVSEHVVWLDLSGTGISSADIAQLAGFKNLTRLSLQGNMVESIAELADLDHLEVLNLHSTSISDPQLEILEQIKSLRKVYLWQTEVSEEAVVSLRQKRPDLEVNFGNELQIVVKEEEQSSE